MNDAQAKAVAPIPLWRKILTRALYFVIAALLIGLFMTYLTGLSYRRPGPAGFWQGMLHGALMPGTMPTLLVGHDISIYAAVNTGRTYKLGYTCGVNACGALFFGMFFWRINRLRKHLNGRK